jgi:hypothetical protein
VDRRSFLAQAFLLGLAPRAAAPAASPPRRVVRASPGNYRRLLSDLQAGDLLRLAAGSYTRGLPLHGVVGTKEQPIVIEGPATGRAVFAARRGAHTVSLLDSANVVIRNLVLDGGGERVDAVRAEGHARFARHVTLERLTIVNHGATQQNSGISTKCPAWGWVVRGNTIVGAGTGMYFGDSDGSDPFFDSLIEGNRIVDPAGFGIQIKHQFDRPDGAGIRPRATVIRHNLIVKRRAAPSPQLARPNLLVGHWPLTGPGAHDRYLIHGNLLFDNPSEALFQGEGNLALYNNLLVNPRGEGVRIQPHNHRPREVAVFGNTIVASALGIGFVGGEDGYERLFAHNLVFGQPPLASEVDGENLSDESERASATFASLVADPDRLDLRPRSPLAIPRTAIPERWERLPGAREDFAGRPGSAIFGACRAAQGSAGPACRLAGSVSGPARR